MGFTPLILGAISQPNSELGSASGNYDNQSLIHFGTKLGEVGSGQLARVIAARAFRSTCERLDRTNIVFPQQEHQQSIDAQGNTGCRGGDATNRFDQLIIQREI